ncbi:MAG: hypothetical protein V2I33_21535, partial [Kangiellaceae bacterium]|nr:hypothetical protein [Kangiellaceae bacterium]
MFEVEAAAVELTNVKFLHMRQQLQALIWVANDGKATLKNVHFDHCQSQTVEEYDSLIYVNNGFFYYEGGGSYY